MLNKAISGAVLVLLVGVGHALAVGFQGLGHLPGGSSDESVALAVSGDGLVAVGTSSSALGQKAFRWTIAGGIEDFDDPNVGTLSGIDAAGASFDGSVLTGRGSPGAGSEEAYRWTAVDDLVGLGALPGEDLPSIGRAVSANGSVIVGEASSAGGFEAFRWTSATNEMVGLGDLPNGTFNSRANATSADGSVVVGFGNVDVPGDPLGTTREAFRWTVAANQMVGLGDLSGGDFFSQALGVSGNGKVVVGRGSSATGAEAFRWTTRAGMTAIGDPAVGSLSQAEAVSANGLAVVGSVETDSGPEAFVWDVVHGMRLLKDVLTELELDLTGWKLTAAFGVSADGTVIVGEGTNPDDQPEAWRAVVPPPPALLGDVDYDGVVDHEDTNPFLDILLNGPFDPAADMNEDGVVNGRDVDPFVMLVSAGGSAASSSVSSAVSVPEPCSALLAALALLSIACFVRR